MQEVATTSPRSESEFAALVEELAADPSRRGQLTDLLREDHTLYDQRSAATISRMRGWVLVALGRAELSEDALLFVLEELDTGKDAYLVAAAARALRSYPNPTAAFAPFLLRALSGIRLHNEPISFEGYGEYASSSTGTCAVGELLTTLAWLGPHARGVLPELEEISAERGGLSKKLRAQLNSAIKSIRSADKADSADDDCCTLPGGLGNKFTWALGSRGGSASVEQIVFEDQDGVQLTFKEFFLGRPTVVAFFYTRCDNPLKCSLTVTKLARVRKLLEERGLADEVQTAAISYDPQFDLPERIGRYGRDRGVRPSDRHRLLRATEGFNALRKHFKLGVNFIESLVNRHRLEVYVLDARGRIAASFQRLHWEEQEVVDSAVGVLNEKEEEAAAAATAAPSPAGPGDDAPRRRSVSPILGGLAAVAVAFFPKCPICWSAYLSVFGITGLKQIPYSPWIQPLLLALMLINLVSVWLRGRATGRMLGFYLVAAGALAILLSKLGPGWERAAVPGVVLALAGSLLSALNLKKARQAARVEEAPAGAGLLSKS